MKRICAALALACAGISVQARVLWDNNLMTNGINGRAVSPPAFPNIRVVDDIRVGDPGWRVEIVRTYVLEDFAWQPGPTVDIYVYNDRDGAPSTLHALWPGLSFIRTDRGGYQRRLYTYDISVGGMNLVPGNYWIGFRNPYGSGSGTNYWTTSDGGPDGGGSNTGYFSLNGGTTWMPEGFGWQHAFRIEGEFVPEPSTILAVGAGLAALAARRRRSSPVTPSRRERGGNR